MEKLWTLKDVANYLGVAYAVACTYSKGGSFPKAIRLPNEKGGYSTRSGCPVKLSTG